MYKILFVCYGNICRSPMAEMLFKDIVLKHNKRYLFFCTSRATSMEEIGNELYPEAKEILKENNIPVERHGAKQIKKEDLESFDYIIVMENQNKEDILRQFGSIAEEKIHLLKEFSCGFEGIKDPWYTGDFITAYKEIEEGCLGLFNYLLEKEESNDNTF